MKSTQFHYPLDPKKIRAEGSMHKDTTYQGSDRQDFNRHGEKKKKRKKRKQTNKTQTSTGFAIGNPVISELCSCFMVFQGAVERTTCMDQKDDVVRNVALKSSSH